MQIQEPQLPRKTSLLFLFLLTFIIIISLEQKILIPITQSPQLHSFQLEKAGSQTILITVIIHDGGILANEFRPGVSEIPVLCQVLHKSKTKWAHLHIPIALKI